MRETAGSATAPAARCRRIRRGSFILNPPSRFTSFEHAAEQHNEIRSPRLRALWPSKGVLIVTWVQSSRGPSNLSEGSPRPICEAARLSYSARCVRGSLFQKILAGFIDRLLASLCECGLAGNHISNSGPNVVMHSDVAVWGKREFGGA